MRSDFANNVEYSKISVGDNRYSELTTTIFYERYGALISFLSGDHGLGLGWKGLQSLTASPLRPQN